MDESDIGSEDEFIGEQLLQRNDDDKNFPDHPLTSSKRVEPRDNSVTPSGECYRHLLYVFFSVLLPVLSVGAFSICPLSMIEDQVVFIQYGGVIGDNNETANETCSLNNTSEGHIQSETTHFRMYMRYASCVSTAVFVPLWGAVSDKYGRHVGIIVASVGAIVKAGSFLSILLLDGIPMWILIVGEFVHGVCGRSITIIVMSCSAHVGDVVGKGKRTFMMIVIDFIHAMSAFSGDITVGYVVKHSGYALMLIIMMIMHGCLLLYSILVFSRITYPKPSIGDGEGNNITLNKIYGYFSKTYRIYLKPRNRKQRFTLIVTLVIVLLYTAAFDGVSTVINIYTLGPPLCWNTVTQGIYTAASTGSSGLAPILIGVIFIRCSSTSWFMFLGLVSGVVSHCLFGFASTTLLMFVAMAISSPINIIGSSSRSVITDNVEPTEIGAAMAGYVVIGLIAELSANSLYTTIFASTLHFFARTFFFVAAAFYAAGLVFLCINVCRRRVKQQENGNKGLIQDS